MKINVKNSIKPMLSLIIVLFLLFGVQDCATYETQNTNSSINQDDGYNLADLNNYGDWVQTSYGNAWQPFVAAGWTPFEYGHWTYADGNWTWVSYEPFGWIVYHYGNWYDDPVYGWVWIPSSDPWSPARVVWSRYDNYVAWAPMPPARVTYNNPWEANQNKYWHVVKSQNFTDDNVGNYRVENPIRNNNGSRNTTAERTPPSVQAIRTSTGKPVPEVKIQHQRVILPKRTVEKVVLPTPEEKKVEENSARVRKNVLVPRDKYKKRESNQKNQRQTNQNNQRERERKGQSGRR
jgi:hypothetical protein